MDVNLGKSEIKSFLSTQTFSISFWTLNFLKGNQILSVDFLQADTFLYVNAADEFPAQPYFITNIWKHHNS